jgi:hypothetical protein
MAKCRKDPVAVLHESIRENYAVLKGLNGGSKRKKKHA